MRGRVVVRGTLSSVLLQSMWWIVSLWCTPCLAFVVSHGPSTRGNSLLSASTSEASSSFDKEPQLVSVDIVTGPFSSHLLKNHWGRQPLLIRKAFDAPGLVEKGSWPSWEDIVDLACSSSSSSADDEFDVEADWNNDNAEDDWEDDNDHYEPDDFGGDEGSGESARLVQHIPNQLNSFTLEMGPFQSERILSLMEEATASYNDDCSKKWTLLVNDVDRYMPNVAAWMEKEFHFLPRWRRDDAQVSIAPKGGGIGPHVDNYDVFLVQASGARTWSIGTKDKLTVEQEYKALVPDLSVRILNNTLADLDGHYQDYELQAGDVLYLPPRVVHWGTADSMMDSMTLSVGCRAPSAADLLTRVAEELSTSPLSSVTARYQDFDLLAGTETTTSKRRGPSITDQVRNDMKILLLDAVTDLVSNSDHQSLWDQILGTTLTAPNRYSDSALKPYDEIEDFDYLDLWGDSAEEAMNRVLTTKDACLIPQTGISFATSQLSSTKGGIQDRFFAFGDKWEVNNDRKAAGIFQTIEKGQTLSSEDLRGISEPLREVLEDFVGEGILHASTGES